MKIFLVIAVIMALVLVGSVMAVEKTATTTVGVTVNQFLSVTLNNAPVTFPNADPAQTVNASASNGYPLTATIGPESNVNAKVETKANTANFDCTGGGCGSATFAVSNMEWSATTTFPGIDYTTSNIQVCASVSAGGTCNIYHQLTIPSAQTAGIYSTGITITATSVV